LNVWPLLLNKHSISHSQTFQHLSFTVYQKVAHAFSMYVRLYTERLIRTLKFVETLIVYKRSTCGNIVKNTSSLSSAPFFLRKYPTPRSFHLHSAILLCDISNKSERMIWRKRMSSLSSYSSKKVTFLT